MTLTPQALEALQVLGVDRPDRSHLEAIQPPLDQQAADVGLRSLEQGGGLCDGERACAVDAGNTSTAAQQFFLRPPILWWS